MNNTNLVFTAYTNTADTNIVTKKEYPDICTIDEWNSFCDDLDLKDIQIDNYNIDDSLICSGWSNTPVFSSSYNW